MRFSEIICKTENVSANKTFLIGYLNLTYNEIVSIFGKPDRISGDNKVEWEWVFKLNDSVLTIYNWKDGPSYTGNKKIKPSNITDWHVGGKFRYDLKILEDYIFQKAGKKYKNKKELTKEA